MIRTDYLPRICAAGRGQRRLQQRPQGVRGRAPRRPTSRRCRSSSRSPPSGSATAWCAPRYNWNTVFDDGGGHARAACSRSRRSAATSAATTRLPSNWIADFRRLYDFGEAGKPNLAVPAAKFNRAMRIDTPLVDPLQHLPPSTFGGCRLDAGDDPRATSRSATSRGRRWCKLATGQQMATFLKNKGVNLTQADEGADPRRQRRRRRSSGLTQPQRDGAC